MTNQNPIWACHLNGKRWNVMHLTSNVNVKANNHVLNKMKINNLNTKLQLMEMIKYCTMELFSISKKQCSTLLILLTKQLHATANHTKPTPWHIRIFQLIHIRWLVVNKCQIHFISFFVVFSHEQKRLTLMHLSNFILFYFFTSNSIVLSAFYLLANTFKVTTSTSHLVT